MLLVEVFDKGAVAAGAEYEGTLFVTDRVVLLIDGDDVGVVFLLGEGDVQLYPEGIFVEAFHLGHLAAEKGAVFG